MTVASARLPSSPWFMLSSHRQHTTSTVAVAIRVELPTTSVPRFTTLFARDIVRRVITASPSASLSQTETTDKSLAHKENPMADNDIRPCTRTRRAPSLRIRQLAILVRATQGRGGSDVEIPQGGGCLSLDALNALETRHIPVAPAGSGYSRSASRSSLHTLQMSKLSRSSKRKLLLIPA